MDSKCYVRVGCDFWLFEGGEGAFGGGDCGKWEKFINHFNLDVLKMEETMRFGGIAFCCATGGGFEPPSLLGGVYENL